MPRWVLTCNNCSKVFPHADISDTLENLFFPKKPKFPPGGLEQECPSCNTKAVYQQQELRYQEDAGGTN
jgi:hypothetical protein